MPHIRPALVLLIALPACTGTEDDPESSIWITPEQNLGDPVATGSGFVVANGTDAWFAAEHVAPLIAWDFPATEQPWFLWDLVQGENIADQSTCPYTQADTSAGTKTWMSDCRSREGYEWTGEVRQTVPSDSGDPLPWEPTIDDEWAWERWDYDLQIIGDIEDPAFDRLTIKGTVFFINGDDVDLVKAAQVNIRIGIDGYWEALHVGDEREQSWNDLLLTGRWEHLVGDTHHFAGTADLGELGGFAFQSEGLTLQDTCSGEPKGTLDITTDDDVTLTFQGSDECDRCASLAINGEYAGRACDF